MARFLRQSTSADVPIGPFLDSTDGNTPETGLTLTQPDIRLKKNAAAWAQKAAAQTLSHEENGNYEVTLDATDTNTIGLLRLHVHESGALPVWEDFHVLDEAVYDVMFGTVALATATNITAAAGVAVSSLGANVITAASMAADVATELQSGLATAAALTTVSGQVTSLQSGVHVSSVADGVLTFIKFSQSFWDGITSYVWGASVGAFGTISDSFASAIAELWSRPAGGSSLTAAEVWASSARTLTAATNITSTGGTTVPQTGDAFARLGAPVGASISVDIAGVQSVTTNVQGRLPADLIGGRMDAHVGSIATGVISFSKFSQTYWDGITSYVWTASVGASAQTSDSFASAIAEMWSKSHGAGDVWDVLLSTHLVAGTTGFALNAAGSAGDPWGTALPGAYGAGTAGKIIGDNINATIGSRLATAGYTAPDNTTIGAISGRIPGALVDGRMSSHTEAISDGVLSFSKFTQTFWDGIVSYVWGASVGAFGTVSDSFASAIAELWSRPASSGITAADVWASPTRLLTAGTNIALAKGTGVTGFNDLSASDVRGAVGLAGANLDTQLDSLPTAAENADAVWDEAVDGAVTARQSLRLSNAALGGKASGLATTNAKFRDLADTKDRIDATVDTSGNRTAVTRDLT